MKIKTLSFVLLLAIVAITVHPSHASAIADNISLDGTCGDSSIPYYTGVANLGEGPYDVYVKLGKNGQVAKVDGYAKSEDESMGCVGVGGVDATGDGWKKLGSYLASNDTGTVTFQLSSAVFEDIPNANRPTLMFVSQTNPICVPTVECETVFNGEKVYITPVGQPADEYTLNVIEPKSLNGDRLKKVEYYADNELLYETKKLEKFDTFLAPGYANKLYRVMYFESGQKAISEQEAEAKMDNFWSFVSRIYKKNRVSTLIIIASLGVAGILFVARSIVFAVSRRRMWMRAHGFKSNIPVKNYSEKRIRIAIMRDKTIKTIGRVSLVIGASMVLVVVANQFIVQIGTVSGHSMDTAFEDGQKIAINKLPVTLANINGASYIPKRGEVVVAYPNFGTNLAEDSIKDSETIIKRVVGLPGERVVIDRGALKVYNSKFINGLDPASGQTWVSYVQKDDSVDYIDVTLGKNELFLCGDNRPVSIDSRFNGPIATSQVVGVVD